MTEAALKEKEHGNAAYKGKNFPKVSPVYFPQITFQSLLILLKIFSEETKMFNSLTTDKLHVKYFAKFVLK